MRGVRPAVLIGLVVLLAAGGGAMARAHQTGRRSPFAPTASRSGSPSKVRAPDGQRIRVQVLNATKTRGLARRATFLLRDRGFDVVEFGTTGKLRDTTVVLDLSGHPEWARSVAAMFGAAVIEARTDSSRYLDIAVLVGTSWRPPAEPFYP